LSQHVASGRNTRLQWTGLGAAALMFVGFVGFVAHDSTLATPASARPVRLVPELATMTNDGLNFVPPRPVLHSGSGRAPLTNLRPNRPTVGRTMHQSNPNRVNQQGSLTRVSMSDASKEEEVKDEVWAQSMSDDKEVFTRRDSMPEVLRFAGTGGALISAAWAAAESRGKKGAKQPAQVGGIRVISDSVSDNGQLDQLSLLHDAEADLFQNVVPSVVYITTEYTSMAAQLDTPIDQLPKGVGTGFVWDKNGHIVTNFHVINKVDTAIVGVTQPDGSQKKYTAKLTGVDPDRDIAVLKIDAPESDLLVLAVGDSAKTRVGQFAFAVGNPFGQDHSLSTGVISGKNREMTSPTGRKIKGVIQTDAAINPGNSGGPLLDSKGRIIGINTASVGAGVSAGVGFAIPMALARDSIEQLIEFGQVQRATLGISYLERSLTAAESARIGLPVVEKGIVVLDVPKGSTAEAAGIKAVQKAAAGGKSTVGDIILAINNVEIKGGLDIDPVLSKYKPNDIVDVTVLRQVPGGSFSDAITASLKLKLNAAGSGAFSKIEKEVALTPEEKVAKSLKLALDVNVPLQGMKNAGEEGPLNGGKTN